MPEFKNLSDLSKYVDKQQGNITVNKVQLTQILERELKRLEGYIKEEIQNYLNSYTPTVYERTGNWMESVRISPVTQVGNYLQASIYFDNALANHPSLFGGEPGYVPWLMEVGWHWRDDKQPRTYRLSDFEGTHYIAKAVERFNSENRHGIKVTVTYNGKKYI